MEATVAALLLVTASVVLACAVVGYSITLTQSSIVEQGNLQRDLTNILQNALNNTTALPSGFDGNNTTLDPGK